MVLLKDITAVLPSLPRNVLISPAQRSETMIATKMLFFQIVLRKMIGLWYNSVNLLEGKCLIMSLNELIRIMRKKALMSQEDFAKALNVSVGMINRWENEKTEPNITAMKK